MHVYEHPIYQMMYPLQPLLHLHYSESELDRPVPLRPDWQRIFQLNNQGLYRALFLFTKTDELIGYMAFFILPSIHTCTLVATHDIFFVRKDWRIGRGAYLLLQAADRVFKEAGVREVFAGHQGVEQLDKLMKRFGYKHVGAQYYKAL